MTLTLGHLSHLQVQPHLIHSRRRALALMRNCELKWRRICKLVLYKSGDPVCGFMARYLFRNVATREGFYKTCDVFAGDIEDVLRIQETFSCLFYNVSNRKIWYGSYQPRQSLHVEKNEFLFVWLTTKKIQEHKLFLIVLKIKLLSWLLKYS